MRFGYHSIQQLKSVSLSYHEDNSSSDDEGKDAGEHVGGNDVNHACGSALLLLSTACHCR